MKTKVINDRLEIHWPEGFHEIGDVAGADPRQVVGVEGIEVFQSGIFAALQTSGQAFFFIADEKSHVGCCFSILLSVLPMCSTRCLCFGGI